MKSLSVYVSRKGATRDMTARIAQGLVVIGSPSYAGSWNKAAVAVAKLGALA